MLVSPRSTSSQGLFRDQRPNLLVDKNGFPERIVEEMIIVLVANWSWCRRRRGHVGLNLSSTLPEEIDTLTELYLPDRANHELEVDSTERKILPFPQMCSLSGPSPASDI